MNGPAAFCNPSSSPSHRSQTQFSIMYSYLICEKPNKNIFKKNVFSPSSRFFSISIICFFKILNSTDPHSFFSLQQSSSYAGPDQTRISNLFQKKIRSFFNVPDPDFKNPDLDQDMNYKRPLDWEPKKGCGSTTWIRILFFSLHRFFSWDGDLNLEPDLDIKFQPKKRKRVRRP